MAETLQAHAQDFPKSLTPSQFHKNIILINKTTSQRFNCSNQSISLNSLNSFSFSQLIADLKQVHPQLNRAFFFMWICDKEYLIGADPFESERFISIDNLQEIQDIIILYTESKNNKKKDSLNLNFTPNQSTPQETQENQNSSENHPNAKEMFVLNDNDEFEKVQKCLKPREKRVKERTIEYVIEKVKKWRDIYEKGIQNEKGEIVKPNLDVSAQLVYLSRKTLDDYYAQLRKGEMYGFDFQKNKHEKMGMLRKYVKEQQKNNPNQKNKGKLIEFDETQKSVFDFASVKQEEIQTKQEEQQNSQNLDSSLNQNQIQNQNGQEQQQQLQQQQNFNDFQLHQVKQEEQEIEIKEEAEKSAIDFCNFDFTNNNHIETEDNNLNVVRNENCNLKDFLSNSEKFDVIQFNNNIMDFPALTLQPSYSSRINREHQNNENDVCNLFMNLEDNNNNFNNFNTNQSQFFSFNQNNQENNNSIMEFE